MSEKLTYYGWLVGKAKQGVTRYVGNVVSHLLHVHPDGDWSIQSKRWLSYFPS